MTRTKKFSILVGVLLLCGCTLEEPTPDFSGLQQLSYSLQPLASEGTGVDVSVYPNPFTQFIKINVSTPSAEGATIYFSDEKGKYSKKITLPDGGRTEVQVVFTGMPKGIYLCEVHAAGKVSRYRLVKAG